MISQRLVDEMNEQIKHELYSAYLYLSMAAHFDAENLEGFANWMQKQAGEEVEHAMKFYEHLNDRGSRVVLQAIDQPPANFTSPLQIFQMALEHEQKVTARIEHLYRVSLEENDFASRSMLNWFIDEQVEEEKSAGQIVETLKLVGESGNGLFMLDRQLGQR
jgi:ferritin